MQSVPVIVPSPDGYPDKFHVELVDESNHIYVITVDGKNTRDDEHLVYASDREAQKWVITYWQQQDAYIIAKLSTQEAWTEPDQGRRRDPNDARQIRLKALVAMNQSTCCRIHPSQLFRFKPLRGHKLPNAHRGTQTCLPSRSACRWRCTSYLQTSANKWIRRHLPN
ncbi:hypothetical protein EDC04DRAFT_2209583 [Pisolithus marmoratus]|nr:hypothetical protein EDC04DRAFT_2209583 [Pisolithus marmoratus]